MTKYLNSIDILVISVLLLLGISLIAFGIAFDSHLYRYLKENRLAIKLYDEEILKTINKNNSREVFTALLIIQKHNVMLQNKKITFHMIFLIGIILCLLAAFYYLSAVNTAIGNEINKIHKYHKDKEKEEKEGKRKKGFGF